MKHPGIDDLLKQADPDSRSDASDRNSAPAVRYAVAQSLAELTLGSFVHSFKVPLGGHLLSLNQALLLTWGCRHGHGRKEAISIASRIANSAAILKALSPTGDRLTPMAAISIQGVLFCLGLAVFGCNLAGVVLGGMLLSVWGFAQPLLIGWLLFGADLFSAIMGLWEGLARATGVSPNFGLWLLLVIVAIKVCAGAGIAGFAWYSKSVFEFNYLRGLDRISERLVKRHASPTLPEVLNPWFVVALLMSVTFFMATSHPDAVQVLLYGLRILAVALVLHWARRMIPGRWTDAVLRRFPAVKDAVVQARAKLSRT